MTKVDHIIYYMSTDKIKKVRVWITEKGKTNDPKTKYIYEKPITNTDDLTKPFEFDVWADFVSDGKEKKIVTDFTFNYDGTTEPEPQLEAKLKDSTARVKAGDTYTIDGSQSKGNITQWAIVQDASDPTKVTLEDSPLKYSKTFVMLDTTDTLHFALSVTDGTNTKADSQTVLAKEEEGGGGTTTPPPTGGKLLYDSNTLGKWNDGKSRTIKNGSEGNINPDGKGLYTAASGSPRFIIEGNGIGHLEADPGHGRIYIKAKNYNARLEFDYMFEDTNIDNISFKLRSRHQEGGDPKNRFGGFGGAIDNSGGEIDFQTESFHNEHENKIAGKIPAHEIKKWYRVAISVCDSPDKKQVNLLAEIDKKDGQGFKEVVKGSHKNPAPAYVDEASFAKDSYFWLRINNEKKTGRVAFKDVVLTRLEPEAAAQGFMSSSSGEEQEEEQEQQTQVTKDVDIQRHE